MEEIVDTQNFQQIGGDKDIRQIQGETGQILEEISVGDKKIDKPLHTQEFPEQKMFGTGGVEGKRMKCAYSVLTFLGVPLLECLETRLKGP